MLLSSKKSKKLHGQIKRYRNMTLDQKQLNQSPHPIWLTLPFSINSPSIALFFSLSCKLEFSSISISFWGLIHLLPLSALCRFTNSDSAGFALFLYLIFTYSTISIVAASFSSLILLASWASSWALVSCFGSSVLGYFFSFFLWFIKIGQKFIKNLLLLFTTVNSFQLGKAHQRISFISFNTRTKPESQIYWSARLI